MPRPRRRARRQDPEVVRLRRVALDAAAAGLFVFPVQPGGKLPAVPRHSAERCRGRGICAEGHQGWEQRATRDRAQICRWWSGDGESSRFNPLTGLTDDTPEGSTTWILSGGRTPSTLIVEGGASMGVDRHSQVASAHVVLPRWGSVCEVEPSRWVVLDTDGRVIEPIAQFLLDFAARGNRAGSGRSYACLLYTSPSPRDS